MSAAQEGSDESSDDAEEEEPEETESGEEGKDEQVKTVPLPCVLTAYAANNAAFAMCFRCLRG